jgi:hypothetical protein
MKNKIIRICLALLVSLGASKTNADEVTDLIESGLKAYADKDFKNALEELKYAEAQIQEMVNKKNETLLPEPPEGWEAKGVKTTSMAMAGGGTMMSREYTNDKQTMKIEIAANSPLMGMMTMMMKNPMMMSGNQDMSAYRYKRQKGMVETKRDRMETKLLLAGQILLSLTLNDRDKDRLKEKGKETTEQFLDSMDFAKIKEALLVN